MTGNDKTTDKTTRKPAAARRGVWVSYAPGPTKVTPHSSEVNALREAVKISGAAKFVEYGTELVD